MKSVEKTLRSLSVVPLSLAVLSLAMGASAAWAGSTALVGATVHPVDGPAIENGTVLVEDGLIRAVGADVDVPADADRVDLAGKHLYPGFVHPLTPLGLSEIDSVRGSVDVREVGENNSDLRAEVAFNADSLRLPAAVAGGVTTALVFQRGGLFSGTSAVMRLEGWNWRDMIVEAPAAMHLSFPEIPEEGGDDEEASSASKELLADLDRWLERAAAYDKAKAAGLAGLERNPKLERLAEVVRGDMRLFVHAGGRARLDAALDWLSERDFQDVVLVTDYQARYLADRLKESGLPVILNGVHDLPRKDQEAFDAPYGAAAALHAAGVSFAIGDGGSSFGSSNVRNLPFHAAMAASYGLDPEQALRSVTLGAAEIIGVADRVGSITVGKEASLIVTNGDPLETLTTIEAVWIHGRPVDLTDDHQYRLYQKYWNRPKPAD